MIFCNIIRHREISGGSAAKEVLEGGVPLPSEVKSLGQMPSTETGYITPLGAKFLGITKLRRICLWDPTNQLCKNVQLQLRGTFYIAPA